MPCVSRTPRAQNGGELSRAHYYEAIDSHGGMRSAAQGVRCGRCLANESCAAQLRSRLWRPVRRPFCNRVRSVRPLVRSTACPNQPVWWGSLVGLRQGAARREGRARRMRTCVACYRRVGQPGGDGAVWSSPTTGPTTAACGPGSGILIRRRALGRTRPGHVSARVASMSPTPGSTLASAGRLVGACAPSPAGWSDAVDHFT